MKSILTIIFFSLHLLANATKYYVSSTGNDAANGTSPATTWLTVAKVNSSMASFNPGDSILFRRGDTWSGSTITMGKAGVSGNNIIISAYGTGAQPIIASAVNTPVITLTAANRGYWTIDNLDMRGSGNVLNGMDLTIYFNYWPDDLGSVPGWVIKNCTSNGPIFVSGPNIKIQNNTFNGTGNAGAKWAAVIVRGNFGVNALIEGNNISNWVDRGIWIFNGVDSAIIRNNTVSGIVAGLDNDGMGINVDGFVVPQKANKVYNNITYNCAGFGVSHENAFSQETYANTIFNSGGGINVHNYGPTQNALASNGILKNNLIYNVNIGIGIAEVKFWTIVNNTIHQGTGSIPAGIRFTVSDTATSDLTFANNIISGTWTHPVRVWSTKAVWTMFDYNDITPNGTTIYLENSVGTNRNIAYMQGLGLMTHGITANPLYVSATDFHLQPGSPAINAGVNVGLPYTSTAPDLGAFENGSYITIRGIRVNVLQ